MALDFSVLQGMDPAGAFFRGQEAVRAEQERNMLRQMQMEQMAAQRQRQQFEFEQAQEDRRRRMEQEGQFRQLADLVRQHGLDPDDPKVLGQFSQAALMSGQPQLASFVTSMAERAAKRRETAAENARIGAILSPQAGQPAAPQNAMARPAPMVNALAAPQQDLLAGTPFAIGPMAAPPRAAVAPAPAAPTDNAARIAQLESQRDALEALGTPRALAEAKRIDRQIERLTPKEAALSDISRLYRELDDARKAGDTVRARGLQARIDRMIEPPAPAAPKEPDKPVEVVGPDGKTIIVSAQEAIAKRMTPAKAAEGLSPKEIQKREASYPKTTAALRSFETQADLLTKNLEKLRDHPGLSGITGLVFGRTPAITAEARSAKADLDNILARGGFAELAAMRQASPTGGALGNISNQEVQYLRQAFGALNTEQDTETFKQKINDVIAQLQTSKRNVREEYDNTYEYRAQRGAAAPAGLSPEDKQALEWANANPRDPRAAQIKQRLGM